MNKASLFVSLNVCEDLSNCTLASFGGDSCVPLTIIYRATDAQITIAASGNGPALSESAKIQLR